MAKKYLFNAFLKIILFLLILCDLSANAQVANYTFSESSGTYTDLVSPTTAISSGWDNTVTANTIPIGFTFGFNGTNYTTCSISSNGFITFGSTVSGITNYTPISSTTGYAGAIAALGVDMGDFTGNNISYLTTGASPNRVFSVQWKDADRFARGDGFNFQIQLNESSNIIKIIYGFCLPTGNNAQNIAVQVGLRGATNVDFNNRSLTTNSVIWDNNTTAGTANTASCRTRSTNYPNSGRTFIWSPLLPPTIVSLGSSNACAGGTITINGTNFAGITAPNVKIGGTAVTAILTNTGTQITATIGAGTTGFVTAQNAAGTGTSASSFTVNAIPIITIQPATPSAICAGTGSRTISVTATGATTYQWRKGGVNLVNGSVFSNVTTATLTITAPATTDAGTYDVVVSNTGSCSVTSIGVVLTINDVPTIATTPTPTNGATGQCFSGSGAITSVSWAAVAGAVNYDVYFGAGSLPALVTSANVAATTYSTGALVANTTYYWRIIAKNACGSAVGSSTWTFTTLSSACVCLPTYPVGPASGDWISNVTLGTLNNNTGASLTPFYTFYNTLPIPDIQRNTTQPISVTMAYDLNQFAAVWIDFNNDGVFAASEGFISTNAGANTPIIINVIVPPGATLGNVRMRIRGGNNTILTTGQACGASASAFGETEDYIVNIIGTTICVATAPPTSLSLSPNNTSISGSFALPSPIADGYLVVRSLSPVAPTPVTGTSYIIGGTVGPGYNVVDTDSNNLFSTTGLAAGTLYYFYVFSVKSICSGGPVYGTVLSGSISTTLTTQGCVDATSTSKTYFLNNFSTVGNLTNVNNVNTGYTNSGYTDYTSLQTTTQIQGGGINCKYNSNGIINLKVWVDWDRNGVFSDPAELVYTSNGTAAFSTSFGFVVPLTAIGNYRLRIRTYSLYAGPPGPSDTMATLTPCGNLSNGETEDYKLNIVADCAAKITNVVDGKRCDTGTVILEATCTTAATQFNWYDAETGGALIGTSLKTGLTNDTIWTTPSIAATTEYWVQAYSPTCASFYREKVIAKVNITTIITFTPLAPTVCGENSIISVAAAGDFEVFDLINEDFEGTPQFTTNNVSSIGFEWTTKPSVFVPTGTEVWRPAISSRNAGNNFAYTTSDTAAGVIDTKLTSNSLNTVGFQDLTLTFRHYLSFYNATLENCLVQASINGGTSWTNIFNFRSNCGEATSLKTESITLPGYLNQSNLQIRFWYNTNFGDGWCIDDIRLYGKKTVNTTFTWGGGADAYADALATIPYNPLTMSLSTVYIKPTAAQLANPTWTFTANATIANGCVVSKPVTITNNNKKWLGSTSNWNTASNWEPSGVPTSSNCVVIPNTSIVSGSGYTGYGKNLIVKSTGNLNIQTGNNLVIEDLITVDTGGVLNIENNSSLVQINNVTNLGNINYTRIAPLIRGYDYVYWSSPVSGQNISSIYTSPTQGPKCFWDTVGINANGGLGNWGAATSSMNTAQGYIIRGSSSNSTPATNIIANFNGVPNNGNITIKAKRGNMTIATVPSFYSNAALSITDDNWSLLGNPYPSAINGLQFLSTNSSNLVGTLAMWRHINNLAATASPFYQNFALNYNSNDYLSINFTGTTVPTASDLIQAGQAFMIQRKEGTQDLTGVDVVFNNSMRLNAGVPYANNAFYRSSIQDNNLALTPTERHRVWLDIIDVNFQKSSTALLGYVQGATQDEDNLFDGPITLYPSAQIFTMIDNKKFVIQGRALPFSTSDIVPIGIKTQTNGNYMIAINAVDGLFNNQNIYLEDKLLNITHDLKSAPYSFTSPSGIYADRFDLKYETTSLSNIDFESISTNDLKIINDNKLSLYSTKLNIKKTEIFDLLGRKVDEYKNVDSKNLLLDNLIKSAKIYIIKTTFNDDSVLSKKVIF